MSVETASRRRLHHPRPRRVTVRRRLDRQPRLVVSLRHDRRPVLPPLPPLPQVPPLPPVAPFAARRNLTRAVPPSPSPPRSGTMRVHRGRMPKPFSPDTVQSVTLSSVVRLPVPPTPRVPCTLPCRTWVTLVASVTLSSPLLDRQTVVRPSLSRSVVARFASIHRLRMQHLTSSYSHSRLVGTRRKTTLWERSRRQSHGRRLCTQRCPMMQHEKEGSRNEGKEKERE